MTIEEVRANNRKRAFEVRLSDGRTLGLPYVRLRLQPSPDNGIRDSFVDEELGREGFTYRLEDGREDSVPVEAVLDYNRDPSYLRDQLLYRLTLEALEEVESSGLSHREIIRRLDTSPSQLYRLLDTTNYGKTIDAMIELLSVLGCDVEVSVT